MRFDPDSPHGGAEEYTIQLATRLAQNKDNTIIVVRNPLNLWGNYQNMAWIGPQYPQVENGEFDVLISIKDFHAIRGVKAKRKILVYPQLFFAPPDVNALVDIHCVMTKAQAHYLQRRGIPNEKIVYIPNCYDSELLGEQVFNGKRVFLQVMYSGATIWKKGLDILLAAWPMVQEYEPQAGLVIVGSCEMWGLKTEDVLSMRDLSKMVNVNYLGYVSKEQVFQQMLNSGLYVHPSRQDCAPTDIIEAQAAGCYVISSNVGGISEYLDGGELFESERVDELVNAMKRYFLAVNTGVNLFGIDRSKTNNKFKWCNRIKDWECLLSGDLLWQKR